MKRRSFLKGCCGGLFALSNVSVGNLVFAQGSGGGSQRDIFVTVFLRGGMDCLSFLSPYNDSDYHTARAALGLDAQHVLDLNGMLGLHSAAAGLKELYDEGDLAIVMACGSPSGSRSHFEAQDYMERGRPDESSSSGGGWLARHLAGSPSDSIFQAVSHGSTVATSLEGFAPALSLSSAEGFTLSGSSSHRDDLRRALRRMYASDPLLGPVAAKTLDAGDIIDAANPGDYTPGNGAAYPNTNTANALASVAQMIRLGLGLQAATVDMGGWDTHESQAGGNPSTGRFADLVGELSAAIHAFWTDLDEYHGNITLTVMSEFGRRLRENDNNGTDHGHGSVMMVLSGNAMGGQLYGSWPGLGYDQLFEHVDLAVTTDFRTVLSEILIARLNNADLANVFPGFQYGGPVGIFGQAGVFPTGGAGVMLR